MLPLRVAFRQGLVAIDVHKVHFAESSHWLTVNVRAAR
jgi:hypothetical protein